MFESNAWLTGASTRLFRSDPSMNTRRSLQRNKTRTSNSTNRFVMDQTGTYRFHTRVIHGRLDDSLFLEGGKCTGLTFVAEVEGSNP